MGNRNNKKQNTRSTLQEFVTVAFAEDMELARQYKKVLTDSEIPAMIKAQNDSSSDFPGIAVMVSEDHLDEAYLLIEASSSSDSFYDLALQEDDYNESDDVLDADTF